MRNEQNYYPGDRHERSALIDRLVLAQETGIYTKPACIYAESHWIAYLNQTLNYHPRSLIVAPPTTSASVQKGYRVCGLRKSADFDRQTYFILTGEFAGFMAKPADPWVINTTGVDATLLRPLVAITPHMNRLYLSGYEKFEKNDQLMVLEGLVTIFDEKRVEYDQDVMIHNIEYFSSICPPPMPE